MALPTRAEIESSHALPKFQIRIYNGSTYDTITSSGIIAISGDIDSTGKENGLSFGDAVIISAQVVLPTTTAITSNWKKTRIIIEMSYASADWVQVFYGFIIGKSRTDHEVTLTCAGIDILIEDAKAFGPVRYRRPIATKTTASTVEDPTSGFYEAGAINEIFWKAGGRPYEQSGTYTNADFYYSCDQSLINPEWVWFSGENLLDELYLLARAGGGQIYQGTTNRIRYVQPFTLANAASTFTINDGYFGAYSQSENTAEDVGIIRAVYTPRYLQGYQTVYSDDVAKLLKTAEEKTIEARTDLPIFVYQTQTASGMFTGVNWNADPCYPRLDSIYYYAQKIDITVTNTNGFPMVINSITINGRPVAAGEKGYVSYGSGNPERNLEDNPYIQSDEHAEMLCRMVADFYFTKPVVTLSNCGYDPDRFVGETVTLSSTYLGISGDYRIIGINYDLGGVAMSLKLIDITGLIKRSEMFIIGTTYSSGDTRKVSY